VHLACRGANFAADILTDNYLRGESASIFEQLIRLASYRRNLLGLILRTSSLKSASPDEIPLLKRYIFCQFLKQPFGGRVNPESMIDA
jgi:hypothetical protein